MTPIEALDLVEKMSPVDLKNRLVDLLAWQVRKDRKLVHVSWYLNCLKYQENPRPPKAGEAGRARVAQITGGIG